MTDERPKPLTTAEAMCELSMNFCTLFRAVCQPFSKSLARHWAGRSAYWAEQAAERRREVEGRPEA